MEVSIDRLVPDDAVTCEEILRSLPEWFGIEAAIRSYRRDIEDMETYVAKVADEIVGFVTLRLHNERGAEIQVMGVQREYHRMGFGRSLVSHAEARLRQRRVKSLEVKTLGPSRPSEAYGRTRSFYEAMGFIPLEETTLIWGEDNPCLPMVKDL